MLLDSDHRCFDTCCGKKEDCLRWLDRDNPAARWHCQTLRHGNEVLSEFCRKSGQQPQQEEDIL